MAAEVQDALAPSSTSDSGFDTASVEGDKASRSPVHDANEEILRLYVKGFGLRWRKHTDWEYIVILRAGRRKVAIQLQGPEEEHSYVVRSASYDISTDHIGF